MNILKINNFGVHEKLEIKLSEFNLIWGENRSGKSTILDALRIIFGSQPRGLDKKIERLIRTDQKSFHIEFEMGGRIVIAHKSRSGQLDLSIPGKTTGISQTKDFIRDSLFGGNQNLTQIFIDLLKDDYVFELKNRASLISLLHYSPKGDDIAKLVEMHLSDMPKPAVELFKKNIISSGILNINGCVEVFEKKRTEKHQDMAKIKGSLETLDEFEKIIKTDREDLEKSEKHELTLKEKLRLLEADLKRIRSEYSEKINLQVQESNQLKFDLQSKQENLRGLAEEHKNLSDRLSEILASADIGIPEGIPMLDVRVEQNDGKENLLQVSPEAHQLLDQAASARIGVYPKDTVDDGGLLAEHRETLHRQRVANESKTEEAKTDLERIENEHRQKDDEVHESESLRDSALEDARNHFGRDEHLLAEDLRGVQDRIRILKDRINRQDEKLKPEELKDRLQKATNVHGQCDIIVKRMSLKGKLRQDLMDLLVLPINERLSKTAGQLGMGVKVQEGGSLECDGIPFELQSCSERTISGIFFTEAVSSLLGIPFLLIDNFDHIGHTLRNHILNAIVSIKDQYKMIIIGMYANSQPIPDNEVVNQVEVSKSAV